MATTAKAKWEKYFSNGDVETAIKPKAGKPIYFYPIDGSPTVELMDGDRCTVRRADVYSSRYRVSVERLGLEGYVSEQFVAKPNTGAPGPTEHLRIQSEFLTQGGITFQADVGGTRAVVRGFNDSSQIMASVVSGLKSNWRVSEHIIETFEKLSEADTKTNIEWNANVTESERNELGKYVGELLPGALALDGDWSAFSDQFITFSPSLYAVPADVSFSGVDSFLSGGTEACLISSKFGPGASASVFSNILPSAVRARYELDGAELRLLTEAAVQAGITAETLEARRGSKEVLYQYGITNVLGMNVRSPMDVFHNIRGHVLEGDRLTWESRDVLNAVYGQAEDIVRERLPGSITQFFSREAARRLNSDPETLADMKAVLAVKDYVQLHLNMPKWRSGTVEFKVKRSADSEIRIVGNKGVIGDIDSRQGTLNYIIH